MLRSYRRERSSKEVLIAEEIGRPKIVEAFPSGEGGAVFGENGAVIRRRIRGPGVTPDEPTCSLASYPTGRACGGAVGDKKRRM